MDNQLRNHMLERNQEIRKQKLENRINLKRELLLNKDLKLNNDNDEYNYLNNYDNQEIIKIKLLEWNNVPYNINNFENYIISIKSEERLQNYFGCFYLEKCLNANETIIQKSYDYGIISFLNNNLKNNKEPELQYISIKCILLLTQGSEQIISSLIDKNILQNIKELLNIKIQKVVEICLLVISNIAQESSIYALKIKNYYFLDYIKDELYKIDNKDIDNSYCDYLLWALYKITQNIELIEEERKTYLLIYQDYILKSNKIELIINCINAMTCLINCKFCDYLKNNTFFIKINNIINNIFKNDDKLLDVLQLIGRFSNSENYFSNVIIKSGFNNIIISILQLDNHKIKKVILLILSNFFSCSREEFNLLMNINGLYDQLLIVLNTEQNQDLKYSCLYIFCNFSQSFIEKDIDFMLNQNYLKNILNFLNNDDSKFIKIVLYSLQNILEINNNYKIKNQNSPIIKYMNEYGFTDKLVDLQEHKEDIIYNLTLDLLEKYFDLED